EELLLAARELIAQSLLGACEIDTFGQVLGHHWLHWDRRPEARSPSNRREAQWTAHPPTALLKWVTQRTVSVAQDPVGPRRLDAQVPPGAESTRLDHQRVADAQHRSV